MNSATDTHTRVCAEADVGREEAERHGPSSTLAETRTYLSGLVELPRLPVPETIDVQAA